MDSSVWPSGFNPDSGFSDLQLEKISGPSHGSREGLPWYASRQLFFPSEMYSHGKTLRSFLKWPKALPIPVFSDHGVHLETELTGPERENAARVHLTWSSWRADGVEELRRQIAKCIHPWVPYRRGVGLKKKGDAHGTIFFVPHSVPGHLAEGFDCKGLFEEAKNLRPELQPRAICIAMHDVHRGLHRELRELGLPIISAGNSASPAFVDRFYDLVSRFSFATSPGLGTQTFLCEEFGVPYFLFGEPPKVPDSIRAIPGLSSGDARQALFDDVFRCLPGQHSSQKRTVVQAALNLSLNSQASRRRVRRILWLQLFVMAPHMLREMLTFLRRQV